MKVKLLIHLGEERNRHSFILPLNNSTNEKKSLHDVHRHWIFSGLSKRFNTYELFLSTIKTENMHLFSKPKETFVPFGILEKPFDISVDLCKKKF